MTTQNTQTEGISILGKPARVYFEQQFSAIEGHLPAIQFFEHVDKIKGERDKLRDSLIELNARCEESCVKLSEALLNVTQITVERNALKSQLQESERRLQITSALYDTAETVIEDLRAERDALHNIVTPLNQQVEAHNAKIAALLAALRDYHPARVWDMARQYYTGPHGVQDNPILAWHHDVCETVNSLLSDSK